MPIIQTNAYICELCRKVDQRAEEVSEYSDPVVPMLAGWGHLKRKFGSSEPLLYFACPECMSRPDKHFDGEVLTPDE